MRDEARTKICNLYYFKTVVVIVQFQNVKQRGYHALWCEERVSVAEVFYYTGQIHNTKRHIEALSKIDKCPTTC